MTWSIPRQIRWPGDFNRDGDVDDLDYDEMKAAVEQGHTLGDAGYEPDLDLDRDGKITNDDFAHFDAWYGKTKAGAGLVSDPAGPDSRVGYAGYVFNPETLIYTVRHRHYEPMLGRFMSTDWLGYADGMNLYEYVGGRAMNFSDPSGLLVAEVWDWFSGGAATESIDDTKQMFCGKITEDRDKGKICQADFEKLWNNGGCGSSTLGEQLGGFAKETGKNVAKGAAATADGFIPFFDPFEDYYDTDDPWFQASHFLGGLAFDALLAAATAPANVCINVCFAEGTLVATEDGLGPIEDVRPGDLVWSFDEATGCATLSSVVRTFESEADEIVEITIGDETIRVTPEHPFWVDGLGWMPAGELRAGTPVLARDGSVTAAALVRSVPGPARVFNLEVAGTHTYLVSSDGLVVHNVCIGRAVTAWLARPSYRARRPSPGPCPVRAGLSILYSKTARRVRRGRFRSSRAMRTCDLDCPIANR